MISFHMAPTIANAVVFGNSNCWFASDSTCCPIGCMEISEIRQRNLRAWIDSDPHSMGNVEAWCAHYSQFAEKPINPSYIRQLVPEHGRGSRNIGEKAARKLEAIGSKPTGWLDVQSDAGGLLPSSNFAAQQVDAESTSSPDSIFFDDSILERFMRLTPAGKGHARARLLDGIAEAEQLYAKQANAS